MLSICCIDPVSAQNSAVYVYVESEGGEFSFTGTGGYWNWELDISGFDTANVDLTNHWNYATSSVVYENIGDGTIKVKVHDRSLNDDFKYYDWGEIPINGNGIYVPKYGGGGRYVNVTGSPNVTGFIECVVNIRSAYFQFDTRSDADLTVAVHNGKMLENATVILTNGAREVQWTDENGEAEFSPHCGKFALLVEADGYDAMLVEDLTFESDKSYRININMTECISSCGSAFCAPSSDALIMYYRDKEPSMNSISPQNFTNYFAGQLTTCIARKNPSADGTLERMATQWGIYPNPALGVLLYECEFEKLRCGDTWCEWNVTYTVKNYQAHPYDYTVSLIADNTTTELNTGTLGATFSTTGRETITKTVVVNCDGTTSSCGGQMYLAVTSGKVGD